MKEGNIEKRYIVEVNSSDGYWSQVYDGPNIDGALGQMRWEIKRYKYLKNEIRVVKVTREILE